MDDKASRVSQICDGKRLREQCDCCAVARTLGRSRKKAMEDAASVGELAARICKQVGRTQTTGDATSDPEKVQTTTVVMAMVVLGFVLHFVHRPEDAYSSCTSFMHVLRQL